MISLAEGRAAGRGLDYLNLFVANIQTGFGPFIVVYLTTRGWTLTAIGIALSVGTVAAMVSQVPAGALVDAIRAKSLIAAASLVAFTASALLFAITPLPLFVYLAEILHGFSSCTLGPSIAAMSLALVGHLALGPRLGRNARFASIGNGIGAALMGACGYYLSSRSVFFLTAVLTLPAITAVLPLRALDRAAAAGRRQLRDNWNWESIGHLLKDRRLAIFAACTMLFTFANAAMLPLASAAMTKQAPARASVLIAVLIVLPQLVMAAIAPAVGRFAQSQGRRPILIVGLCAVGVRGILFAAIANPLFLIPVQLLDGISSACFGVLVPLAASDITTKSGHYNLSLGLIGLAVGIGATSSTAWAGATADRFGQPLTLLSLAAVGLAATLFAALAMPETRPDPSSADED
jgi:MFS family permease